MDHQKQGAKGHQRAKKLPRSVQHRAKHGRRQCQPATHVTTLCTYGPPKDKSGAERLWRLLRRRFPEAVESLQAMEKEREEEKEETRIPDKEMEKLTVLKVQAVNFHMQGKKASNGQPRIPGNGEKHHTSQYACTKVKGGQAVLRRGQEFKLTITFDRPYDKAKDDLSIIVEADEDSPGKDLSVDFKLDEERKKPYTSLPHWAARIMNMDASKFTLKLAIYIPATCAIGEWDLKIRTSHVGDPKKFVYECPKPFIVLFNPWCCEDQTYYPGDPQDLAEYVMNQCGTAYYGSTFSMGRKGWFYGQFQEGIVQVCVSLLKQAFDFKMSAGMADPVKVTRALSKIVNCNDDDGVLVGNWSGDYKDGREPTDWASSATILRQFDQDDQPVKFGQCWVFSHVLTAVCRALGIPCRSVTNFDSAHDTEGTCTIDSTYDEDGNQICKMDSIWNFHVWNEVWILRPDIEEHDCHGWHVIDATPQEQSDGVFQCGPCPVKAVKNGWVYLGCDTAFVFSEVNADVVHWLKRNNGDFVPTKVLKGKVGQKISTKPCDGKPHDDELEYKNTDDPAYRMDLTECYKYKEGTEEERCAVKRAVGAGGGSSGITARAPHLYDMEVDFEDVGEIQMGQDLKLTAVVKNATSQKKDVKILITCRSSNYRNDGDDDVIFKETLDTRAVSVQGQEKVQFTVPWSAYFGKTNYCSSIYAYAKATNVQNDMPYTAQMPFSILLPPLSVQGPKECKTMQAMLVTMSFTNPVDKPLTQCQVLMDGDLKVHDTDTNGFQFHWYCYETSFRDVKPKETVTITVKLYWEEEKEEEDDEEEEAGEEEGCEPEPDTKEVAKSQRLEFYCKEMSSIDRTFKVTCIKA